MKKENYLKILILFINVVVLYRISFLILKENYHYNNLYNDLMKKDITSSSSPRGRILDRSGHVLVDNVGVKSIIYTKLPDISEQQELKTAKTLASILNLKPDISEKDLKSFYLKIHKNDIEKLIDKKIKEKYLNRVITSDEYIKYQRYKN